MPSEETAVTFISTSQNQKPFEIVLFCPHIYGRYGERRYGERVKMSVFYKRIQNLQSVTYLSYFLL